MAAETDERSRSWGPHTKHVHALSVVKSETPAKKRSAHEGNEKIQRVQNTNACLIIHVSSSAMTT
jgi:hypothetical protein